MTHKYYSEDTPTRKKYFEKMFFSLAKDFASKQGITLSQVLSRVKDFESFKETLNIVWSEDSSLLAYFEGMGEGELREFFNREGIQNLISDIIPEKSKIPDQVFQVKKKIKSLFLSQIKEKKTGKTIKTFAKEEYVTVRNKKQLRFRDSKGRFAKKLK